MRKNMDIGIDLGNSKFSICSSREGILLSEAAYIAFRGDVLSPASVIAVGDDAREMFERAHPGITVCRPMRDGIVIDSNLAGILLHRLAKKIGLRWYFSKPRVYVGALFGATAIERKAFINVAEMLGPCHPQTVVEPLAAANAVIADVSSPLSHLIVDVGDGATEAMVVSMGQTVMGSSMRFGGTNIEDQLVEYLHRQLHFIVSRSQARRLKENLMKEGSEITVKGLKIPGFLPAELVVQKDKFNPIFEAAANHITDFVLDLLSKIPPEMAVDLVDTGLYLCGGSSQLPYVQERLESLTGLEVKKVDNPEHTVITGLSQMLKYRSSRVL